MIKLTPQVRSLKMKEGHFALPGRWRVHLPRHFKITRAALKRMNDIEVAKTASDISVKIVLMQNSEAYRLAISSSGIFIACSTDQAAFWAVATLSQIIKQSGPQGLPCLEIEDAPALTIRGYMLDISRDKIPLKADLLRLIDLLSALKYNHLELYVEGFSFYYPSFASLYGTGATPLRPEEYLEIEKYCASRGIDCVPSHNTFGHMTAWLARPEFHGLANSPEGMMMWGMMRPASTLNPLDPKSLELVKTYTADVLKISSSAFFNLNMDEPYELGSGKTAAKVAEVGAAQVFLDYFHSLYDHVKSYHKTPLIWGDFLLHHPEAIAALPKDTIFIDWGYDMDYPFMEHAENLASMNVHFMLAPGTCSWNSITGRTQDMLETIHQSTQAAIRYHGLGILITDWGDNGHVQPATISLPAIVYGGIEMWSAPSGAYQFMVDYLNDVVFKDASHQMAEILLDLGRYNRHHPEYRHNSTAIADAFMAAYAATQTPTPGATYLAMLSGHAWAEPKRYQILMSDLQSIEKRLKTVKLSGHENKARLIELREAIALLKCFITSLTIAGPLWSPKKKKALVNDLMKQWPKRMANHQKIWKSHNRPEGLTDSLRGLQMIAAVVADAARSI